MAGSTLEIADLASPLDMAVACAEPVGSYCRARHLEAMQREIMYTLYGPWDACVIMAPPRHGKSEFCSRRVPAWHHNVYPHLPSIVASYGLELARHHSRWVRDEVHRLQHVFGHNGVDKNVAAASDWQMSGFGNGMKAVGVGGGITGRGAHLLIIDDAIKNAEQAVSERIRNSQWEWFQTTAFTRINTGGKLVMLGTRWHEDDVMGKVLQSAGSELGIRVREMRLPALAEPSEAMPDPLDRFHDEPLWPEMWGYDRLCRVRESMEDYWWSALFQQRLGIYGRNEWPESYFFGIVAQDDEWPVHFPLLAVALDPSKGKNTKSADYQAIVSAGFKDGYIWVDADIKRRPVPDMIEALVDWNVNNRPMVCGIESVAFQELLAESYIEAAKRKDYHDDPVLLDNRANKNLRIGRLGFWLRLHRIKIRNTQGGQLLIKQLKEFPNGDHDDGPDALEMAIRLLLMISDSLAEIDKQREDVSRVSLA